ncbi:MAG: tRNA (adenosine(37)-N6)-dimethylallyltransferase MiaA [Thermomonas sp.]
MTATLDMRPRVIALMGPTASGKSAYALELAQRFDGEIVSVDSALVYRGLDIGTAKPTREEQARVPHHLMDVRDPWQPYSAAEFAVDAKAAIDAIVERGNLPILAGGTGLYFRALLEGLATMPQADSAMRTTITSEAVMRGWAALHGDLADVDPEAARRIHATDAQRIQRALEVYRLSGRPISDLQREAPKQKPHWKVLKLVLAPPRREVLHARIEQRFDAMLGAGFLDEVRALRALPELAAHPAPLQLPAIRAVGYRQAYEFLDGECNTATFRERAIAATRQLAKRQFTWLRGELDARWFDPVAQRTPLDASVAGFLGEPRT